MRSTNSPRAAVGLVAAATLSLAVSSCGAAQQNATDEASAEQASAIPRIIQLGSGAREYTSLNELADISSALVIAVPTGNQSDKPLPESEGGTADSAPTTFVEMRVKKVLSGSVTDSVIDVVTPGTDQNTGGPALLTGGPYLMYITPAMYGANRPVGGYVVTGGPAGVYASNGVGSYMKVDRADPKLPSSVDPDTTPPPGVSKSEAQLIAEGPQ